MHRRGTVQGAAREDHKEVRLHPAPVHFPQARHAGLEWHALDIERHFVTEPDLKFLSDYTHRFREFVVMNGVFDSPEHKNIFLGNIDEALSSYRQRLDGR